MDIGDRIILYPRMPKLYSVLPLVVTSNSFFLQFSNLVYDVTRRETFTNLVDIWAKEVELYCTNHDCIKILVGNKVDKVNITVYCLSVLYLFRKRQKTIQIIIFLSSYYLIIYLELE